MCHIRYLDVSVEYWDRAAVAHALQRRERRPNTGRCAPRPSEEGTTGNILRTFTWNSRPESGLDSLICAFSSSSLLSSLQLSDTKRLFARQEYTWTSRSSTGTRPLSHTLCSAANDVPYRFPWTWRVLGIKFIIRYLSCIIHLVFQNSIIYHLFSVIEYLKTVSSMYKHWCISTAARSPSMKNQGS